MFTDLQTALRAEAHLAESQWLEEHVNMKRSHVCSEQEQDY
jgi:hypothetical protein